MLQRMLKIVPVGKPYTEWDYGGAFEPFLDSLGDASARSATRLPFSEPPATAYDGSQPGHHGPATQRQHSGSQASHM